MSNRMAAMRAYLERVGWHNAGIEPLAGDASIRRYFRLERNNGDRAVLMDAPPDTGYDIRPFLGIANLLSCSNLNAPSIFHEDVANGFIVMEDFGDALFARVLEEDPATEVQIYNAAVDVLIKIDAAKTPKLVPSFTIEMMVEQASPAYDWYAMGMVGCVDGASYSEFTDALETLLTGTLTDSPSLLLRDFHAENLIWLPDRPGLQAVGLLDFQDAMAGPPGYDLVSLLLDARRDVSATASKTAMD